MNVKRDLYYKIAYLRNSECVEFYLANNITIKLMDLDLFNCIRIIEDECKK